MKKIALSMLLLIPAFATAQPTGVTDTGIHYNTVGAGLVFGEFDDLDLDASGLNVNGSFLVNDNIFITATATWVESDTVWVTDGVNVFSTKLEMTDIAAGVGGRYPVAANVDLTGTVGLARREAEAAGASDSDSSVLLRAGIRAMVTPKLELGAGATYTDLFDDSGLTYELTGAIFLFDRFAAVGGLNIYEDATFWNVGVRLSY